MKSLRILFSIALLSVSTMAFAQSDAHDHAGQSASKPDGQKSDTPKSDAQKSFDQLKNLAGTWHAKVTMDPPMKAVGDNATVDVSLRVTSRGNALVHEMGELKSQEDPTKYDHPVTMFYLDGDRLLLTHYCDAGNRPRMAARISPDGKTVEFDFLDVAGNTQYGNMYHAVFTFIDANHHTEDWTFKLKGDKLMHGHMELERANPQVAAAH